MSTGKHNPPETDPVEVRQVTEPLMELLRVSDKKMLEQFSTSFTHEINQPLTALLNYLQTCLRLVERNRGGDDVDIGGILRKAINEARRADEVVTRLRFSFLRCRPEMLT